MTDQFNKIYCRVELSSRSNSLFVNHIKMSKSLTSRTANHLKEMGVSVVSDPVVISGIGGGGPEFMWGGIVWAWQNKDWAGLVVGTFRIIFRSFELINTWIHNWSAKPRPRAIVTLSLRIERKLTRDEKMFLQESIIDRLVEMKYLADGVCSVLSNEYSSIYFDQVLSASINSKNFNVYYETKKEDLGNDATLRTFRLFNGLRIKNKMDIRYNIGKFIISRTDRRIIVYRNDWTYDDKEKKYYFFLTNKLLSDWN